MNFEVLQFLDGCYKDYFVYKNQFLKYLTKEEEKFGYHWNSAFATLLRQLAWTRKKQEFMWHVDEFMKRKNSETPEDNELAAAVKRYTNKQKDDNGVGGFAEGLMFFGAFICMLCPYIAIFVIPLCIFLYKCLQKQENNENANEQNNQE